MEDYEDHFIFPTASPSGSYYYLPPFEQPPPRTRMQVVFSWVRKIFVCAS